MPRLVVSTKARKSKAEKQKESRISTFLAPVKQYFRSQSPTLSSSAPRSRQPSPNPPSIGEPNHSTKARCKSNQQHGANDLWSKAYEQIADEYKNGLDNLDKLDVLQKLLEVAKQAAERSATKQFKLKWGDKEINVREKAEGFVGWLNKFKEIGDIVVQYDPVYAALPWAGVRFILMVCDPLQLLRHMVLKFHHSLSLVTRRN